MALSPARMWAVGRRSALQKTVSRRSVSSRMPRDALSPAVAAATSSTQAARARLGPVASGGVGDGEQGLPHVGRPVGDSFGHLGPRAFDAVADGLAHAAMRSRRAWPSGSWMRLRKGSTCSLGARRRMRMMTERVRIVSGSQPSPAMATAA